MKGRLSARSVHSSRISVLPSVIRGSGLARIHLIAGVANLRGSRWLPIDKPLPQGVRRAQGAVAQEEAFRRLASREDSAEALVEVALAEAAQIGVLAREEDGGDRG